MRLPFARGQLLRLGPPWNLGGFFKYSGAGVGGQTFPVKSRVIGVLALPATLSPSPLRHSALRPGADVGST